ncbi:hypothetical protein [Sphingomonas solaris]|uniref:Uncharacterized protein n=1 Tax=Alterirhizorhabdus solaris TaxID=2529389 RepID=A0A558R467_9SPHN|nr:hypothetical protein [Sphingomonas solaris]TVV74169.1 hypothetical protein FOY91_10590 [Sphingomonas solaris]
MEAPVYPPAAAYEQPVAIPPSELRSDVVSLVELMSAPTAWAIVLRHAPVFQALVQALQPILSNMTVSSFVNYGVIDQKTVAAIDAELLRLPRSQWPVL